MQETSQLTFAKIVDVSHSLPGLAFAFQNDLLDLWVVGAHEELGAVEADTAENLDRLDQEAGMEHGLGKVLRWRNVKSFEFTK